ncbi:hypothetical protein RhiirA5_507848 [Rhizophagus irregularis]|uniref:Uncharacterized protein n=1 Tax=Rhizophagus irregularis TaxID=588596 RepID=A0A2N0NGU1_9GLOM|nr:hypothetical protein RhiirA5_507848 [Rhizophagus irregularis]
MKNKDTIRNLEYEITTKEQIIKEHEEKVTNLENLIQDLVKKKEQDMSLSHKKVKDNMVKQRKICHVGDGKYSEKSCNMIFYDFPWYLSNEEI